MRYLLTILLLLISTPAWPLTNAIQAVVAVGSAAGGCTISGCSGAITCTGSTGCLIRETFEGSTSCYSGFDSSCDVSWHYANLTDFTYTVSPAPLQGANSMQTPNNLSNKQFLAVTSNTTVYATTMASFSSVSSSSHRIILGLEKAEDEAVPACRLSLYNSTTLVVCNSGGTERTLAVSFSADTPYYFKIVGVAGSGANASCNGYYSANGSSWTGVTASTDGTWTDPIISLKVGSQTDTCTTIFDDIRVSTSDINYW